jgi:hypothetical protein
MRLMPPLALAAIFVLAGVILDSNYQRSTPDPAYIQGTIFLALLASESDPQSA